MLKSKHLTFLYPLLALPLGLINTTYFLYIPKIYSESLNVDLTFIGIVLALTKIVDALTDPICGNISDKLFSKNINRAFLMIPGAIITSVSLLIIADPNQVKILYAGADHSTTFLLSSLSLFIGLTLITIPYEIIGVSISENHKERSFLIGLRDGVLLIGILLSSMLPLIWNSELIISVSELCKIYAGLILLFTLTQLRGKPSYAKSPSPTKTSLKETLSLVKKNTSFNILTKSFIINSLGAAIPASLFFFYTKNILKITEKQANTALLIYFLIGILLIPLWIKFANSFNKKRTWFTAQLINSISFIPVFFLSEGDFYFFVALISASAIGFGGTMVIPSMIQAEIIKNSNSNEQDGVYIGIWNVAKKVAQGFGSGIALYAIGISNESEELFSFLLKLLYCLIPSLFSIISIFWARKLSTS